MAKTSNTSGRKKAPVTSASKPAPAANGNGKGNGSDLNGDCGNGKIRCKSLVIDGTKYRTQYNKKFENRKPWENPDHRKVISQIPGTVLKVLVEPGQEVERGEQMLILEAMKMKNKILFNDAGIVKKIHVKEGDKIPKDHLMLEMK